MEAVMLWIALTLSPFGTSTGQFDTEQECREARSELAAKIVESGQPVLLSDCFTVSFAPAQLPL